MRATAQRLEFIHNYLTSLFGKDLHAKRVCSLSHAVLGVMTSASFAVAVIGQALAQARSKAHVKGRGCGALMASFKIPAGNLGISWAKFASAIACNASATGGVCCVGPTPERVSGNPCYRNRD
jgi:hypothetical protein